MEPYDATDSPSISMATHTPSDSESTSCTATLALPLATFDVLQRFAYMIERLHFFKLFVPAKYHDKSYQI